MPIATLIAALIAAVAAGLGAYLQRKTGRETAQAAKESAGAAQESVAVTAETARAAGIRSDAEALARRYQDAAALLGHDKAAVRLAGVYAMARLADDWRDQRQTCVDVLCGYLRIPYRPNQAAVVSAAYEPGENAVRLSVLRIIRDHLRDDATTPWHGSTFRLYDVTLDGGDFSRIRLTDGYLSFYQARLSGSRSRLYFADAKLSGGTMDFTGATFSGGTVDFTHTEFRGGTVKFDSATFSGGTMDFTGARFSGGIVDFTGATFWGGIVDLREVNDWSFPARYPEPPPRGLLLPAPEQQPQ